jgi:hypothetical protein
VGPACAWSWYSNSPLAGCGLQRERLRVFAWDDAHAVYLLDVHGRVLAQRRSPRPLACVAAADTGERLVAVGGRGEIWWLDDQLRPLDEVYTGIEPTAVAVDPHGLYAAVAGEGSRLLVVSCTGQVVADAVVGHTLNLLAFVPGAARILVAAEQGHLACHDLYGRMIWKETMFSTIGGMAVDETGDAVLLACYGHGLMRFHSSGRREGAYHVERSPHLVSVDYDGSHILAGTIDGRLLSLNYDGVVLADRPAGDKLLSLAMDALGRFAVVGFADGEVRLQPWEDLVATQPAESAPPSSMSDFRPAKDAAPFVAGAAWGAPIAKDAQEAASAVLAPIPATGDVGVFSAQRTLRVFSPAGALRHESVRLEGAGRTLCAARDWLAAATDRRILAYDPEQNQSTMAARSVFEVSHVAPLSRCGELLVVEACDQATRLRLPDEVVWKHRLPMRIAQFEADEAGRSAMVFEDGQLAAMDPEGRLVGRFRPPPRAASLLLARRADGWATASLEESVLRGHDECGDEQWSLPLPWNPWSLRGLGAFLIATSADGRSLLADASGRILEANDERREGAAYLLLSDGRPARMYRAERTVLLTTFDGRLLWRRSFEDPIGALAADARGAWVMVDHWLVHFSFNDLPRMGA